MWPLLLANAPSMPFRLRLPRPRRRRLISLAACLGLLAGAPLVVLEAGPPPAPGVAREVVRVADNATSGWELTVALPLAAEMVAFSWTGATSAEFTVRGQRSDRSWTEPVHLDGLPGEPVEASEGGPGAAHGTSAAGPAWVDDDLRAITVRLDRGQVRDLDLHAIDAEPVASDGVAAAVGLPAAPNVYSRAQWGADESWRSVNSGCGTPSYALNATYSILHHTAGSNSYGPADTPAILRGIYEFHVFGRGWCDVAYNFFVDRYGQVFEGRYGGVKEAVVGGHTGGFNTGSTGVAVVGDFTSSAVPSATYSSLRRLLAFKLGHHGIDPNGTVSIRTVDHPSSRFPGGQVITMAALGVHGDFSRTSCPGEGLRGIVPWLRGDVAADIGSAPFEPRVVGDWDGNGTDTVGVYSGGSWSLRNSNSSGPPSQLISYGYPGALPVVGDWDGDGRDGFGVYDNGWWLLRNTPSAGPPEIVVSYGYGGVTPVTGDWNGDGRDGIGIYDSGSWLLREDASSGAPNMWFGFGWRGPTPLVGDWNGDGVDGIAVWSVGQWSLRETASAGGPHLSLYHGDPHDRPVAGDWANAARDGVGLQRGAYWYQSGGITAAVDRVFWF